jgi:hypothetical protein
MTIQNNRDGSLSDAKRLLAELLFGLIDAIGDKNDTASKALRWAPPGVTGQGGAGKGLL